MFTASIPHSGLKVPPEASYLKKLKREIFLQDVDLFVDSLYAPALKALKIPCLVFPFHRYAADFNRRPEDIPAFPPSSFPQQPPSAQDQQISSAGGLTRGCGDPSLKRGVGGAAQPLLKKPPGGIYWRKTTKGNIVASSPLPPEALRALLERCFFPYDRRLKKLLQPQGCGGPLYHIDLHSMPSRGRAVHRDPLRRRPHVTVSDRDGASAAPFFAKAIVKAFAEEGFQARLNHPYKGGRITQEMGDPGRGRHAAQIELRRNLYMDERSFSKTGDFAPLQKKLTRVLRRLKEDLARRPS